jgi:hypothetical protein
MTQSSSRGREVVSGVPAALKIPVPFEYAFPGRCSAQRATDFDKRGKVEDDQARDKETGERIWAVTLLDLDPEAARFGRDLVNAKVAVRRR